ncbi:M48 family metalloprotease [uncultured Jatrophihabitans sp.]|uniref:M48 family metallopeptidase n=1 Tax=uncultured Jatrophihabitans sp. TaxID=1610747 RepID=UPI0035C9AF10
MVAPAKGWRSRTWQRERLAGFAANRALWEESRNQVPLRRGRTSADVAMIAVAFVVVGSDLALLGLGCYLLIGPFIGSVRILGVLLVLIALECRPRMPRLRDAYGVVSDASSPHLRQLLDMVSAEIGAPQIAEMRLEADYNASCFCAGWRRRPVLTIGLPLWAAIDDDARLALLGHEVGHLVNGDPTTALYGVWGGGSIQRLAEIFSPRKARTFVRESHIQSFESFAGLVLSVLFVVPYLVFSGLATVLWRLSMRDQKQAEIYADALGLRLGGSAGLIGLHKALLFDRTIETAVRSAARASADPAVWKAAASAAIAQREAAVPRAIQRSIRHDAERYGSHPPAGLRLRLAQGWPAAPPAVIAPDAIMRAIDRELSPHYADVRRTLIHGDT